MGTTAEKLNYLKETKTQIKNALETPYNVFRDYPALIKKYIDNQPTKNVSDGICNNAVDVPLKSCVIDGNSKQETTEGYNLVENIAHKSEKSFTNNGITYKFNDDGTILANGVATANSTCNLVSEGSAQRQPIKSGEYIISGNPNKTVDKGIRLVIGVTGINEYYNYSGETKFTVANDNTYYYKISISNGATCNNLLFKPMLYEGTEKKPYEPYTGGIPSPNPKYSQQIESVDGLKEDNDYNLPEGCIGLEQRGKNWFDWTGVSNTTIATFNNFIVTLTWNTGFDCFLLHKGRQIITGLNESKIYKISFKHKGNSIILKDYQTEGNTVKTNTDSDYVFYSFSITGITSIRLDVIRNDLNGTAQIKELMISELVDETYEPYHEPKVIPINLNGNSLVKVDGTKDKLKIYRNGDVEIEKNIGKVVLDGSEDYDKRYSSINQGLAQYTTKLEHNTNGISTHFKTIDGNTVYYGTGINFNKSDSHIYINVPEVITPNYTVVEWKQWLSEHPIEVYYQLSKPEIIKLPSIAPIELWQGTNIFKLITSLDTDYEIEYVVNKENILDEVQTAMLEAEIEI